MLKKLLLGITLIAAMAVFASKEAESASGAEIKATAAELDLKRAKTLAVQSMAQYCKWEAEGISMQMKVIEQNWHLNKQQANDGLIGLMGGLEDMVDDFLKRCGWMLE